MDKADQEYFKREIEPLLSQAHVEFVGEINEAQKPEFLSGAKALLFPIDWSEPFGLVMIESMACGTPVIAFNRGSVPEVIDHGVTGLHRRGRAGRGRRAATSRRIVAHGNPRAVRTPLQREDDGAELRERLFGAASKRPRRPVLRQVAVG